MNGLLKIIGKVAKPIGKAIAAAALAAIAEAASNKAAQVLTGKGKKAAE